MKLISTEESVMSAQHYLANKYNESIGWCHYEEEGITKEYITKEEAREYIHEQQVERDLNMKNNREGIIMLLKRVF